PVLVAHDPRMDLVRLEGCEQAGVELDLAQGGEVGGRCAAARAGAAGDEEVLAAGEGDQPVAEFGSHAQPRGRGGAGLGGRGAVVVPAREVGVVFRRGLDVVVGAHRGRPRCGEPVLPGGFWAAVAGSCLPRVRGAIFLTPTALMTASATASRSSTGAMPTRFASAALVPRTASVFW